MKSVLSITKNIAISVWCLAIIACHQETRFSPILTEADSALAKGNYEKADSLLKNLPHVKYSLPEKAYIELLELNRKYVNVKLSQEDFYIADSLVRYYQSSSEKEKYVKSLLFLGCVYRSAGDYVKAGKCLIEARKVYNEEGTCIPLNGWLYQEEGDLYFLQQMYDESILPYQKFHEISAGNNDTLRMALSSSRMGRAYTVKNDADSAIFYFMQSIRLGEKTKRADAIVPYSRMFLSDIYIQLDEFEEAFAIMNHDSINTLNWAYWHLGQHHTDSAYYYFEKLLNQNSLDNRADALRNLIQLERDRGNEHKALEYAMQLTQTEDSIKSLSKAEELRKERARSMIEQLRNERDAIAHQHRVIQKVLAISIVLILLLTAWAVYAWRSKAYKRKALLFRNKRIEVEQLKGAEPTREQIQKVEQLRQSPICQRLMRHAGEEGFRLSNDEWKQLGEEIDRAYDNFTARLLAFTPLTEQEKQVCYLLKMDVPPAYIADLLNKSRNSVSMLRQRLYRKITGSSGTAKKLDELIRDF